MLAERLVLAGRSQGVRDIRSPAACRQQHRPSPYPAELADANGRPFTAAAFPCGDTLRGSGPGLSRVAAGHRAGLDLKARATMEIVKNLTDIEISFMGV
jgi:hypothetical protein